MTLNHAYPDCTVEIYPYEGGQYSLGGPSSTSTSNLTPLLSARVQKPWRASGSFALALAPFGPQGLNGPSWASIITPKSLVIIGMRRGTYARVVMLGVVDAVSYASTSTPRGIQRILNVQGSDFSKFFDTFSYFNLTLLTGLGAAALGPLGLPTTLNAGLTQGTPDVVGAAWYNLMAGSGGILDETVVPYRGNMVRFGDVMSTWFQPFGDEAAIPTSANFLGDQGSWMEKFATFFPFPWYELTVDTADVGFYPSATAATQALSLPGYPDFSPVLIARRNVLPTLYPPSGVTTSTSSASGTTVVGSTFSLVHADWEALSEFYTDSDDALRSNFAIEMVWSDDEVRNFYILNPTYLSTLFGGSNSNLSAFALSYAAWVDVASIHRYGYRPETREVAWMADPTGSNAIARAANGDTYADFQAFVGRMALRVAAYHQPTAVMARATITLPLRPDIPCGQTFWFAPYKDGVLWKGYIEGVEHSYVFGGQQTTTLTLTRCLPLSAYEDYTLLRNILIGNAMRQNGKIVTGLPSGIGNPLASMNQQTAESISAATAGVFASPNPGASQ